MIDQGVRINVCGVEGIVGGEKYEERLKTSHIHVLHGYDDVSIFIGRVDPFTPSLLVADKTIEQAMSVSTPGVG